MTSEQDEALAMDYATRGNGMYPFGGHPKYDAIYVAPWLEDVERVSVFFRKDERTLVQYHFKLVLSDAPNLTEEFEVIEK